jgi:molecular chaperone HtpG
MFRSSPNTAQYIWESVPGSRFTITPDTMNETLADRGLKKTNPSTARRKLRISLRNIWNSFLIPYPIQLTVNTVERELEDDEEETNEAVDENKMKSKEADENAELKEEKKVKETKIENKELNKTKLLWTRNPSEITKEEYGSFYKSQQRLGGPPRGQSLLCQRPVLEFKVFIFIPERCAIRFLLLRFPFRVEL